MGWILVIEENLGFYSEIDEALTQIDPKLTTIRFANSSEFLQWMEKLQNHDPEISPVVPGDKFLGLVTGIESWKFKDVRLIGKFKALFVQKKLAEKEDDLFVVFTGYETPNFHKKRFEYKSVNNFIFKPFDKVLLKQLLDIAINGRQPIKTHYTHPYKSDAKIEMLKEIQLRQVGELSMKTISEQKIEPGTIAKYYADFFETQQHRSALAQVVKVEPRDQLFDVTLRFFALDQAQSFKIQKLAQEHKKTRTLEGTKGGAYEFVFVKHESSALADEIQPSFERFYDHPATGVATLADLEKELPAKAAKRVFVFIDHAHIAGNEVGELAALHKLHPKLSLFVLSPRIFSEQLETEMSAHCEDIFYAPFNRSYLVKGLKIRYPDLSNKEDLFESVHDVEQTIHVSNPVQLVQVSEAGLIMNYRRELPVGSFREFVFWMPHEIGVPTLLAQCNFCEKAEDGKSFNCHFIFFGLHEHDLKFMRRWMLLQYVGEKQKGAS
jgi:hypothetical protein